MLMDYKERYPSLCPFQEIEALQGEEKVWDYEDYNREVLKDTVQRPWNGKYDERTIDQLIMECMEDWNFDEPKPPPKQDGQDESISDLVN